MTEITVYAVRVEPKPLKRDLPTYIMRKMPFRIFRVSPAKMARWQLAGALVFFAMILFIMLSVPQQQWHVLLNNLLENQGWSASLILLSMYMLAVIFMVPLSPFAIAAGVFFGFWQGAVIALVAINAGALLTFLITRYWLRRGFIESFRTWQPTHAVTSKSLEILTSNNVKIISLLRLNPLVPFSLHNYLYGAAKTDLRPYLWGTFLGSAPFTLLLVYFGVTGRVVYSAGSSMGPWQYSMIGLGIVLSLVLVALTKYARSASHMGE